MAGSGTKAIVAALLANGGIAIAKFVGFLLTGSGSLLAESVHSVADTGNQGLLLLGGKRAERQPTPEHNFGFGRERYFWAFVVALVLFSLGSMFALFEGYRKVAHPHEVESLGIAVGILVVAIFFEGFSFRTAIVEANKERGQVGWWDYIRRSKKPELPVVLLEDLGALIGLVFALAAVLTAHVTGNPVWDGIGTIGIGVLLGIIATVLAIEMKSLLIGESAPPDVSDGLRRIVLDDPDTERLLDLKTQFIGPESMLTAIKVQLRSDLSTEQVVATIDRIERAIRTEYTEAHELFIEPDLPFEVTHDA